MNKGKFRQDKYLLTWTGQSLCHILLPLPKSTHANMSSQFRIKGNIKKVRIVNWDTQLNEIMEVSDK